MKWISCVERLRGVIGPALARGVAGALVVFLAACISSYVIFLRSKEVVEMDIRQDLTNNSWLVAGAINGELHKSIRHPAQIDSPEYIQAVAPLQKVLKADSKIKCVFTAVLKDDQVYFVLDPTSSGDNDHDGVDDKLYIMEPYPEASEELKKALREQKAITSHHLHFDRWGMFLTGYAPFYDHSGVFEGVVGVSISAAEYVALLSPVINATKLAAMIALGVALFVGFLITLIGIRTYQHRESQAKLIADLESARDKAEESDRAKSDFLANMSHELRTPMHAILSFANFGLKDVTKLPEETPEKLRRYLGDHFTTIRESGTRLLGLINDLLDLSKLESGKMVMDTAIQPIQDVVQTVMTELAPLFDNKKLKFVHHVLDQPSYYSLYDKGRVLQVMRNILSNAIKFTPEEHSIYLFIEEETAHYRIIVDDEGMGIPDGELEAIFDKFIQSSKTKSGAGGTGLGLAICREIIQLHQGNIWAEHRVGAVGTRMIFTLPKVEVKDEQT
jgi:signal transduction histidine kinase